MIREQTVEEGYHIGCPDVVEVEIDGMKESSGRFTIDAEGRIPMALLGHPRVEGHTVSGLADLIAAELDMPSSRVRCRVAEYHHSVVFVHGPIEGSDQAILYRGPENVISFIRRSGGLTNGADLRDVHVIRGNVALGTKPQVFTVDLEAILLRRDPQTNVLLQPFDEICIGELPRSRVRKALPHWLRPLYRGFCGVFPSACKHEQSPDQEP